jgi:hypothetical protein
MKNLLLALALLLVPATALARNDLPQAPTPGYGFHSPQYRHRPAARIMQPIYIHPTPYTRPYYHGYNYHPDIGYGHMYNGLYYQFRHYNYGLQLYIR